MPLSKSVITYSIILYRDVGTTNGLRGVAYFNSYSVTITRKLEIKNLTVSVGKRSLETCKYSTLT